MARLSVEAKERVRDRLIAAAAAQFADHGLDGASIDDISLGAGCAKGTVYNYFASKEALFAEVLAEGCRRAVARAAVASTDGTVRERLRALAEADVIELQAEEQFVQVVVREAMTFRPSTYPMIIEHLAPYLQAIEGVLANGQAVGEVRTDRLASELALLFVGTLTLLYVQYWGSQRSWPELSHIADLAVTMFLDGAGKAR